MTITARIMPLVGDNDARGECGSESTDRKPNGNCIERMSAIASSSVKSTKNVPVASRLTVWYARTRVSQNSAERRK